MDARADDVTKGEASSFYIQATTSIQERWPRTLKHGDTFALFDQLGDVTDPGLTPGGIFHNDMRYLSELELLLFDQRPLLLSSAIDEDNVVLTVDLSNPDIYREGAVILPRETLHIRRSRFIWRDTCYERIAVRNFNTQRQQCLMEIRTGTDFADIFEVRGAQRPRRGTIRTERPDGASIHYNYDGLDDVKRSMCIRFDPAPEKLEDGAAYYDFELAPDESVSIVLTMYCGSSKSMPDDPFSIPYRAARREARKAHEGGVVVESTHRLVAGLFKRAKSDLQMLTTITPQGPYPCAGTPWFSTPFGRDGLITALLTLWASPILAKGVLGFLAANQATEDNPEADAQPGKILHEIRHSEMTVLKEVPFGKYYGSADSTPLFVLLAAHYYERTGDLGTMRALWPNIEAALGWIDKYGDRDNDGFVEYFREGKDGLVNQGWKDSSDSIMHADGSLAQGPIALCEVQGYVYAAKRGIADVARQLGDKARGERLKAEAESLRKNFEDKFWCEELGTYALALDGGKKPCRVRSSNAGQVLMSEIASRERAHRVAQNLLTPEMFSGWGIRTLSMDAPRYNPISYHDGSIWPHDNAIIALGLGRYGFRREASLLFRGMFDAACHLDLMRLPELFCGFPRRRLGAPTLYPVACMPQAWASAAPYAFLEACLGLHCDYDRREVHFRNPHLPAFVEELRIRNLAIAGVTTHILIRNRDGEVSVTAEGSDPDIAVRLSK
ncbi:MAG: amylo-alpha-1,6-glucosidase [Proteobacteria bacterium]|nr:amylo-alpha-1,6-glucosidase [Pseudomonadota bacterium]